MKLDHETFKAAEELSKLHAQIADGRTTLEAIKKDHERYVSAREKDVLDRIDKALTESREALLEISTNHQELTAYGNELRAFALNLKGVHDTLVALTKDFIDRIANADAALEAKRSDVSELLTQIRTERVQVTEDRKQLKRERARLDEGWRLLTDRRAAFDRAWEELTRKQTTNV